MKKYIKILAGVLISTLLACDPGEFDDINKNPNAPSTVNVEALFANGLFSTGGTNSSMALWTQQMSRTYYTSESHYETFRGNFAGVYSGPLMDLQFIIDLEDPQEIYGNIKAASKILQAYFYLITVDTFGPVPFSEALQGTANLTPKYDAEKDIYAGVLESLAQGEAALDESKGAIGGDPMLGGDVAHWKKFANSLIMQAAVRISDTDLAQAKTYFAEAYARGGIVDVSDNINYLHFDKDGQRNFWFTDKSGRFDYAPSDIFVDFMEKTNDPRIDAFINSPTDYNPAEDPEEGKYVGMPYGLKQAEASAFSKSTISSFGTYINSADTPMPVLTASQTWLNIAEAASLGWISGITAKEAYEKGVRSSMEQFDVTEETLIDEYLKGSSIAWQDSKSKELLGNQKWVSLFFQPYDAWRAWRKFDFPVLTPTPNAVNPTKKIPVRLAYGNGETVENAKVYEVGVKLLGGEDNEATRLWWDKF
ncbi:hypothetical protein FUAX_41720 (plasmid) [Fulvitalea axinellae]|uniref:SusD/RagB family nutrient-binding outer membrane lipoprotein n=1 Tax=Fulvitalea axinellae TaxID=1182444 RepID=A0AAU9DKF9_9BACT|nr:hypothetical protein FUAX_41720 [Fulvitalea axinellae]